MRVSRPAAARGAADDQPWGYLAPAGIGVVLAATGLVLAVLSFRLDTRTTTTAERKEPALV